MNDPVMVSRRPRGKGLRSRKAKLRKATLRAKVAPIMLPPESAGAQR